MDSIIANDYPKDRLEVLVVDGMSEDKTRVIVEEYARRHAFIRLLDNPKVIPAAAFNKGLASAIGDLVMLMSAHSTYPKDYVSNGLPVISTTTGGIPELLGDGAGLLVPHGDADTLASAIDRLSREPELRERLGASARERVEQDFDVRKVVERLAQWFCESKPVDPALRRISYS